MKYLAKFCLIFILMGLFIYQSSRTIKKFQAQKTSLQVMGEMELLISEKQPIEVTQTDEGSILFPSISICKDEMYDKEEEGILSRLESGGLSVEDARQLFEEKTFSRSRLVKDLRIKTVDGANNHPCNTISGPRKGLVFHCIDLINTPRVHCDNFARNNDQ